MKFLSVNLVMVMLMGPIGTAAYLASFDAAAAGPTVTVIDQPTDPFLSGPNGLVAGPDGVLYGNYASFVIEGGNGAVFKFTPPSAGHVEWSKTIIHQFGFDDGSSPEGKLLLGRNGELYGTAGAGGMQDGHSPPIASPNGTVFMLKPPVSGHTQWTVTVLYTFYVGGMAGEGPDDGVTADANGALYGTTTVGGAGGGGTVFKLTPPAPGRTTWTETTLHSFGNGPSAPDIPGVPNAPTGLLLAPGGVLFGTTGQGGPVNNGTVYQLTPPALGQTDWAFTILHNFGDNDGKQPTGNLVMDWRGDLYGTTALGSGTRGGNGVVFRMTPPPAGEIRWPYYVIHTFSANPGGATSGVIIGRDGALYGAAYGPTYAAGYVFRLSPPPAGQIRWTPSVLYSSTGTNGNPGPANGLIFGHGSDGYRPLFAAGYGGGGYYGDESLGTVFELKLDRW